MELKDVWEKLQRFVEEDKGWFIYIDPDYDDKYLENSTDPVIVVRNDGNLIYVYRQPIAHEKLEDNLIITFELKD